MSPAIRAMCPQCRPRSILKDSMATLVSGPRFGIVRPQTKGTKVGRERECGRVSDKKDENICKAIICRPKKRSQGHLTGSFPSRVFAEGVAGGPTEMF